MKNSPDWASFDNQGEVFEISFLYVIEQKPQLLLVRGIISQPAKETLPVVQRPVGN